MIDELWEKYYVNYGMAIHAIPKPAFQKAMTEYGEHIKAEAVKVCREVATERMPAPTKGFCITNDGLGCAAAIERMEIK